MRWTPSIRILLALAILSALAPVQLGKAETSWPNQIKRTMPFNVSRGVVRDTLLSLTAAAWDSVITISGDTIPVLTLAAGCSVSVVTRTRYVESPNDQLRAYDMQYFPADSGSHWYDADWIGGERAYWRFEDIPYSTYTLFEINGSPDSVVSGFENIVFVGAVAPDSSVENLSMQRGSVDGNVISSGATITAYMVRTDSLRSSTAGGRISTGRTSIMVDTLWGYSGTQVFLGDGKVYVGLSDVAGGVWMSDGLGEFHKIALSDSTATAGSFFIPFEGQSAYQILASNVFGQSYWADGTIPLTAQRKLARFTAIGSNVRQAFYMPGLTAGFIAIADPETTGVFLRLNSTCKADSAVVEIDTLSVPIPLSIWALEAP